MTRISDPVAGVVVGFFAVLVVILLAYGPGAVAVLAVVVSGWAALIVGGTWMIQKIRK